jgi:hypothetical protein
VVPTSIDLVDINGDGMPDIVLAGGFHNYSEQGYGVAYLTQKASSRGSFNAAQSVDWDTEAFRQMAVADMNGDGLPDLALSGDGSGNVRVYYSDASNPGTFNKRTDYASVPPVPFDVAGGPFAIKISDVNRDGYPDVILGDGFNGVQILLNDATHPGALLAASSYPVPDRSLGIAISDVNGNGNVDVVTGDFSNSFDVLGGDGSGALGAAVTYSASNSGSTQVEYLASADLDGDGLDDVVLALSGQNELEVFLHQAPGGPNAMTIPTAELNVTAPGNSGFNIEFPVSVPGSPLVLTASVLSPSAAIPTGSVTFMSGTTTLGTVILDSGGHASLTTTSLPAGTNLLSYVYSGDGTFATVTSQQFLVQISGSTPTVAVSASPTTAIAGAPVTLTTTVSGGAVVPTGTVKFFLYLSGNLSLLQTVPLDSSGKASFSVTSLPAGSQTIDVTYFGDAIYNAASGSTSVVIQPGATLTLTDSQNNSAAFQPQSFTATLSNATTIAGVMVAFYDGSVLLATAPTNASGVATYQTSGLRTGFHSITAQSIVNSTPLILNLSKDSTTTSLSNTPSTLSVNQSVILTAAVQNKSATMVPSGSVEFTDSGVMLGTVSLDSNGNATYSTVPMMAGTHNFVAAYAGSTDFQPSSGSDAIVVAPPDFSINVDPSTLTIPTGQNGSTTVTLAPQGGFADTVQLSCGSLPQYMSCSFASSAITLSGNTTQTVHVTFSTASTGAHLNVQRPAMIPGLPDHAWLGLIVAPLLFSFSGRVKLRRVCLVSVVLMIVSMSLLSGCGGANKSVAPPSSLPGSYTITINAAGQHSTQTHNATVTVSVQ